MEILSLNYDNGETTHYHSDEQNQNKKKTSKVTQLLLKL